MNLKIQKKSRLEKRYLLAKKTPGPWIIRYALRTTPTVGVHPTLQLTQHADSVIESDEDDAFGEKVVGPVEHVVAAPEDEAAPVDPDEDGCPLGWLAAARVDVQVEAVVAAQHRPRLLVVLGAGGPVRSGIALALPCIQRLRVLLTIDARLIDATFEFSIIRKVCKMTT